MQTYKANIKILPLKELLDPQGKAVANNIGSLGITGVQDVRIGKFIELYLTAESKAAAESEVEKACKELLANQIMENYEYEIEEFQAD
ncbi:MAG: phosphoribosylformylglycinamidine synthase subunit PurS [Saprospirales bacterium]|nr:MAG: phosphoribosylformylglycinamidine synthase subunit PurS [Saprospirales bacterium]